MNTYVKLDALGQAALEALVAGAGIAFFFALGLRGLAMWSPDELSTQGSPGPSSRGGATVTTVTRNPAGLVLAVLSFAIVVTIVVAGLYVMFTSK